MRISILGIVFTLVASIMTVWFEAELIHGLVIDGAWSGVIEHGVFLAVVSGLIYGNLVFQACRYVHYRRHLRFRPASSTELESLYDGDQTPSLTVLIPCYKEEPQVVYQTLMSAAMMEFPAKRIALLVDDPPEPKSIADLAALTEMRSLPDRIRDELLPMRNLMREANLAFARRSATKTIDLQAELQTVAALYEQAYRWYRERIDATSASDHVDRLFVQETYAGGYSRLVQTADFIYAALDRGTSVDLGFLRRHYRRLGGLFDAELTVFERKEYVNLSHVPNKAMNLNSYIALMGSAHRVFEADGERRLATCSEAEADFVIPNPDYIITLDADSILSNDYAIRLVHLMEKSENRDVAIAQTPYSAFPGSHKVLERVAGATTDIQHLVHQGFTGFNGTYWVGANALIRRRALDDIVETDHERGYEIRRYIQDRTVIEDTESSVDLGLHGWRLFNYPARLAYSATPPDPGSLLIQRRRWSNGGLIILPKLLRYLFREGPRRGILGEAAVRIHYLVSPTLVNAGVLILLLYPFELSLRNYWLPLTALPYFVLYGRDMVLISYRWLDLLRVYALNLLLIPVNLGGILKSLQQVVTGRHSLFGRTPKVNHRMVVPAIYVLVWWGITFYCIGNSVADFIMGRWAHGIFAAANSTFLVYALVHYVGLRNSLADVNAGLRTWLERVSVPMLKKQKA